LNIPAAILLGVIQGLTEFLPVSSSAHLILARLFFGWETPSDLGLAFDVALHLGTLAAILTYFRGEIAAMCRAVPTVFTSEAGDSERLIRLIAVGTVPIVIVGLLFTDLIEDRMRTPVVAAVALALGAIVMIVAERVGRGARTEATIGWGSAFAIGCAQAAALIPGVSRSGSTIAIGMFLAMRRDAAARFTFLLAIPATLAAAGKESLELRHLAVTDHVLLLFAVGIGVSGVVGYITIKYFLRFLAGHRLDVFAYYRLLLAVLTAVWLWRY
jgi:undecaprenyl-diphosphatase